MVSMECAENCTFEPKFWVRAKWMMVSQVSRSVWFKRAPLKRTSIPLTKASNMCFLTTSRTLLMLKSAPGSSTFGTARTESGHYWQPRRQNFLINGLKRQRFFRPLDTRFQPFLGIFGSHLEILRRACE